jgi:hypothetical protein
VIIARNLGKIFLDLIQLKSAFMGTSLEEKRCLQLKIKKINSSYLSSFNSPIFHDTGCTPTSFFKDKPSSFQAFKGQVRTADTT